MSRPHSQVSLAVTEASEVGQARRTASVLAREQGLDESCTARVALVVTELAGNIIKHAGKGEILLRMLADDSRARGIELLALDRGPGMSDTALCFTDGYSTAGSPGTGLGAVSRLADSYDVYSRPGSGTVLVARIDARVPSKALRFQVGAVCLPIKGESVSGDAWDIRGDKDRGVVLLADGLGHGAAAAQASEAALKSFAGHAAETPAEVLTRAHAALRSTRGAAVAVAELLPDQQLLRYAGVGNISANIVSAQETRSLVSHNGTVGLEMRRVQSFDYPWSTQSVLIMYSDGLQSRWDLADYPGLLRRHPSLIAAVLYRDFSRKRDDIAVVVVRELADP